MTEGKPNHTILSKICRIEDDYQSGRWLRRLQRLPPILMSKLNAIAFEKPETSGLTDLSRYWCLRFNSEAHFIIKNAIARFA
jgi:hypothetical protein